METTVLDDSKIEDDDVVDIVFTLTSDYVDQSKAPITSHAPPPQPEVYKINPNKDYSAIQDCFDYEEDYYFTLI